MPIFVHLESESTAVVPAAEFEMALAGQSNMEGVAVVDLTGKDYNEGHGTLASLMGDPVKAPMFKHLRSSAGKWAVRDDVWVRYQRENAPLLAGQLGLGFSVYGDQHHFGPELQFGHVIGDAVPNQVLLIKTAWGGKSLNVDFRPPSSGGTVGPYYTMMIAQVRTAMANLKADFPDYDGGGVELAGFGWWHGWNDFCDAKAAASIRQAQATVAAKMEFKGTVRTQQTTSILVPR